MGKRGLAKITEMLTPLIVTVDGGRFLNIQVDEVHLLAVPKSLGENAISLIVKAVTAAYIRGFYKREQE